MTLQLPAPEIDYPDWVVETSNKTKKPVCEVWEDIVTTNIKALKAALVDARSMSWGAHAHEGNRLTYSVGEYLKLITQHSPEQTNPDILSKACKARMGLCDLMWRANKGV